MQTRLAELLRDHQQAIFEAWEAEVRQLPGAQALIRTALRDHLPLLLKHLANLMARPREQGEATERTGDLPGIHALQRLGEGYDLSQVVTEYQLLRRCVLRLWAEHGGPPDVADEERVFQEVIDQALNLSVGHYTAARERTLRALDRISVAALGSSDLPTFLSQLIGVLHETVEVVDAVVLMLREGEFLRVESAVGVEEEKGVRVRMGEGFVGTVAATRTPLLVRDADTERVVRGDALQHRGLRALYGVPLVLEGELLGVVYVGSCSSREFSDEDMLLFRTMAVRITLLLAQAQTLARERAARAEAEAALARLRESEGRLKHWEQIFTHLGVGVALVRASDDVIEELNPAFARMHGYTREELLGRPLSMILAPQRLEELPRHVAVDPEKVHHEYEALHLRKDGSRFPALIHVTLLRDCGGRVSRHADTVADITQRRSAEAERQRLLATLEAERALLASVLEQMPAGVVIAEAPSGRLVMVNQQVEVLLGRSFMLGESILEYNPYTVLHADGRRYAPGEWPLARSLLTGQEVCGEELEVVRADGTRGVLLVSSAPIRDRDGHVLAAVMTFVDVTERRRMEGAARQAAQFGERLIAIVSHDLRGPLNAIHLSITQLLHSEALPEREQQTVTRIAKAADRMRRMIADLLDFTRGRLGGGIPIQLRPVDLRAVVRQGMDELEAAWPERTLLMRVEAGRFDGTWDPDRLAQVVSNLGGNALQYSPPETPVTVRLLKRGREVVLEVHNQGAPIPPEAIPYLFDPFRRATRGTGGTGLGLGLYIVEQVVKGHGGRIEVISTAEEGTCFRVLLPRTLPGGSPPNAHGPG